MFAAVQESFIIWYEYIHTDATGQNMIYCSSCSTSCTSLSCTYQRQARVADQRSASPRQHQTRHDIGIGPACSKWRYVQRTRVPGILQHVSPHTAVTCTCSTCEYVFNVNINSINRRKTGKTKLLSITKTKTKKQKAKKKTQISRFWILDFGFWISFNIFFLSCFV